MGEKYSKEDFETVLETYARIIKSYNYFVGDRTKKKEVADPIINYILKSEGYEYKFKKGICKYYQKGNQVFINRTKSIKHRIITRRGLETVVKNNFDYAYCTVDPKNLKEFAKVFDFKSHNLSYAGLSEKTRILMDLGFAASAIAIGYVIWGNLLFDCACGWGGLLLGSKIVNKISDKKVSKNLEKLFEFDKKYKDMDYNRKALIKLSENVT